MRLRAFVIYQWLAVLQRINPDYYNDAPLPAIDVLHDHVDKVKKRFVSDALHTSDEASIKQGQQVGDDIASVRTNQVTEQVIIEDSFIADPALQTLHGKDSIHQLLVEAAKLAAEHPSRHNPLLHEEAQLEVSQQVPPMISPQHDHGILPEP